MIKMKFWTTSPLLSANLKEIIWESSFGAKKIPSLIRGSANWFFFFRSFLFQIWPRFSRYKTFSLLIIANRLFACLLIRASFFLQANMSQKKSWIHVEAYLGQSPISTMVHFCKNSLQLLAFNFFEKELHHRCLRRTYICFCYGKLSARIESLRNWPSSSIAINNTFGKTIFLRIRS